MKRRPVYVVYRAYDAAGDLLYIGSTGNLGQRKSQHKRKADWYPLAASWDTIEYPTRDDAYAAESEAIDTEAPPHNNTFSAAELEEHIRKLVAQAPPFTDAQRSQLAALIQPAGVA